MALVPSVAKTSVSRYSQPLPLLFFGGEDETAEDGSKYNPSVISFLRDEWVAKQALQREAEYTEYRSLRMFVGTWNVNGKFPKEDLTPWLNDGVDADATDALHLPDVYVIGLQEMVDLTVTNVALGSQSAKRTQMWLAFLEKQLNSAPHARYVMVSSHFLVGIMICVFVKEEYSSFVTEVQDAEAPVGVMGVMGNKGGASVRFKLFDSTFCFVCAHLAAHRGAVAQRNADFAAIMNKTEFRDESRAEAMAAAGRAMPPGTDISRLTIAEHDFVVWFGDFNYRIVETVATEKCFALADGTDADLEQLRQRDQLNLERAALRSFNGFTEGPLTFRPTYKFQPGTSMYEQRPDKKLRAPAWCDRILWRAAADVDPRHIRQVYYGSVDSLLMSDHKPVHSLFDVDVKTIIQEQRVAVVTDIIRQLDAMENRSMPKVQLSDTTVALKDVVYGITASASVTLTNVGEVAAAWRFVPKPEEKWFCKTWMSLTPAYGMLAPGEKVDITVTVNVDDAVARDISLGRECATTAATSVGGLLEDILILRMERGRDYYVTVSATVLPTAFGCSLAQLARRAEPMRALAVTAAATATLHAAAGFTLGAAPPAPKPGEVGTTHKAVVPDLMAGSHALTALLASNDSDVADFGFEGFASGPLSSSDMSRRGVALMGVPKEIWRLVDVLFTRGMATRGLFLVPGDNADVLEIRECLDTGDALSPSLDILAVAQVLLDLLTSLREPVIPCNLFPGDLKSIPLDVYVSNLLRQVTALHYNVLVYLVRFGREILAHAAANGVAVEDLAFVFSRALMRRYSHDEAATHSLPEGSGSAAPEAASAPTGRDDEEGHAIATSSLYADKGTRWEPSRDEQENMTRVMSYLLTAANLAV